MSGERIVRYTIDEILEKNRRGEVYHNPDAPEGPSLGEDFWKDAVAQHALKRDTIALPVEREMMEWFKAEYEDYPVRMNDVLRTYMKASQRKKAG